MSEQFGTTYIDAYRDEQARACRRGPESTHGWTPINGWTGRYRCDYCRAIGHKSKLIVHPALKFSDSIWPYVCQRKDCHEHAVSRKPQRCETHRRDR